MPDSRIRLAVGGHLVAVGGHHAVTVGVHGVVIDPIAVVVAGRVKLAGGNHGVLGKTPSISYLSTAKVSAKV